MVYLIVQLQKRKTNADYPLLLPKSYDHCYVPEQIMKSAFCCNCQVVMTPETIYLILYNIVLIVVSRDNVLYTEL